MLIKKIRETIEKYSMLRSGDRVIVGVSGGPDSVALLHLLNELRDEYRLHLIVAHLNHGLRMGESDRDERFVKELAGKLSLRACSKKINAGSLKTKGVSLEERARQKRYEYFDSLLKRFRCNRIALGHTADDQAETILMRFVRGSGLKGLSGIPPTRKNGTIIRPLIESWRKEIEDYLKNRGFSYVQDSSNLTDKFLRNRFRNELIPFIEKNFNPGIKKSLVRMAGLFSEEEKLIENYIRLIEKNLLEITDGSAVIKLKNFNILPISARLRIIRKAVKGALGDTRHFDMRHFEDILRVASSKKPNLEIDLPRDMVCIRSYGLLRIGFKKYNKKSRLYKKFKVLCKINGKTFIKNLGVTIKTQIKKREEIKTLKTPANIAYLNYDRLKKPLYFRNYTDGDRFIPFGSLGSKKVKDFFIDEKLPRDLRRKIPLLVSGDEIAWIVGFRIDERFKVTSGTERVLVLKTGEIY